MKKLILILTAVTLMSFPSEAETVVGEAPDPYEKIWATATEEDIEALKQVVWYESALAECPAETNIAVIETILNRCLSGAFPDTIKDVCYQRGQFYYRKTKIENKAVSDAIKAVQQNGRTILPSDYTYFATAKQSLGEDHLWIGAVKANGKPSKGKGMYFCRGKK